MELAKLYNYNATNDMIITHTDFVMEQNKNKMMVKSPTNINLKKKWTKEVCHIFL